MMNKSLILFTSLLSLAPFTQAAEIINLPTASAPASGEGANPGHGFCRGVLLVKGNSADEIKIAGNRPEDRLRPEALKLKSKVSFSDLKGTGAIVNLVEPSPDGKWAAVYKRNAGSVQSGTLNVIDMSSGEVFFSDEYTYIKSLTFLPGGGVLAIDGTKEGDQQKAKLYVQPFFDNPWMTEKSKLWLRKGSGGAYSLELPGSRTFGVGVKQVIAREDLPYVFVVQDSANPVGSSLFSSGQANQGTNLFLPGTLRSKWFSDYDGLAAIRINLNPVSRLMALTLHDPIVAHFPTNNVAIVDGMDPKKIIYSYEFNTDIPPIPLNPEYTSLGYFKLQNKLSTSWSADGQKLAMVEASTGSVVTYDVASKQTVESIRQPEDRWPIVGSTMLSDGKLFLLRFGQKALGLVPETNLRFIKNGIGLDSETDPVRLFAYTIDPKKPFSDSIQPEFELKNPVNEKEVEGIRNPDTRMWQARSIIEMKDGTVLVVVMNDRLIIVNRNNPDLQKVWAPTLDKYANVISGGLITSVTKISETKLQVSDRNTGIFDFDL